MVTRLVCVVSSLVLLACACGGAPAAPAASEQQPVQAAESEEILARAAQTERAEVLHVLIGWAELAPAYGGRMDERGKSRSKADADKLAMEILERARGGEDFRTLMKKYSEDWASADGGTSYPVSPDAQLVPPFKALSLRLEPGETGLVETVYGWHIIQRIE